jgi:hypothetical protein
VWPLLSTLNLAAHAICLLTIVEFVDATGDQLIRINGKLLPALIDSHKLMLLLAQQCCVPTPLCSPSAQTR